MIFSVLTQSVRMRHHLVKTACLFIIMAIALGAHASAATNEAEARVLFIEFVAVQNGHSVSGVKALLWDSPGTLLLARGVEIRGPGAIADRFQEYYAGTWHVEPDMSQFHVTSISKDVMQFLVPVVFTRGRPERWLGGSSIAAAPIVRAGGRVSPRERPEVSDRPEP